MIEIDFEKRIRKLLREHLPSDSFSILESKKVADIVIVDQRLDKGLVYFLEVKYDKKSHGRLGFGQGKGKGFQPEILKGRYDFFEKNLRWIIGREGDDKFRVLSNDTIRKHLSGGVVGPKYNNISRKVFETAPGLSEDQFLAEISNWLGSRNGRTNIS